MDKIYRKMSANGSVQYRSSNNENKPRHLPETSASVNFYIAKEENENFKMINTNKTSLYYTNPTSSNYKRNEFRHCYDNTKEISVVEDSTRIRKPIAKRESFFYNSSTSSSKDLNRIQRKNMTPPITSFKQNNATSSNSSSPQQQQQSSQQQQPFSNHQMQYGAIYQPSGNVPVYSFPHHQGYVASSANENHQQQGHNTDNSSVNPQQQSSSRGRSTGGMMHNTNRRGRTRGANSNVNNGNMNPRRDYNRQNNNQQSAHQNSISANDGYMMDPHQAVLNSSPYQQHVSFIPYPYTIHGSIPTAANAQNLTGQPLFTFQPPYFMTYGAPYPFVYNYPMPPQIPQMPSEVLDGEQSQDANAPQPMYPYHIAYQPDQHHMFTDTQIPNTERLEFHGSMPVDEYHLQMMNNPENFTVEPEVPNVENLENLENLEIVDYHHHQQQHHEDEIIANNPASMYEHKELIEKTRDLNLQQTPPSNVDIKESPDQFFEADKVIVVENINSPLQFSSEPNSELNLIEQHQQQQQQQQQQNAQSKKTSCVPISSNQTNVIKKQTASVSVSAIPNKHFEEIKIMNDFANDPHQQQKLQQQQQPQHQQQQHEVLVNQNINSKNNYITTSIAASSKHSPKSLKDEKKTDNKQNDSQRTSLSEQAKQQIVSTITSNVDSLTLSLSSSASNKKDSATQSVSPKLSENKEVTASKVSVVSTASPSTVHERSAQNVKQQSSSSSGPPSSWAGLFNAETSSSTRSRTLSSSLSSNQIINSNNNTKKSNSDLSNPAISATTSTTAPNHQSNNQNNPNKTPGVMSYSAVSAQSVASMQSSTPITPSANKSTKSITTTSTATSTSTSSSSTLNNNNSNNASDEPKPTPVDQNALKLGDFFSKYKVDYGSVSLLPRGLQNKSNYCYINAILQALVACPPFYHLMKSIPTMPIYYRTNSKSPVTDAMVELVSNFSVNKKTMQREKLIKKDEVPFIATEGSFEPNVILKMLQTLRNDMFPIEGRQEDAEEFLSFILNKMNDEMIELKKLVEKSVTKTKEEPEEMNGNLETSENEEEWQVISGTRNKSTITRTTDYGRSPISDIFGGKLRARVHREGDHSSDNIEPFFTLKLVIERASSVKEALDLLVGKDQLEGFTCTKTNQEISAWQQVTLEELPVVLILHLKCFDFRKEGCTKILKTVEFPIELKIDQKLLASKNKYQAKQKQYKLFAVVYHDGKDASKGHYVSDIWNSAHSTWIRYDDSTVKPVTDHAVLHPKTQNHHRVPYLLFYRRHDTIGVKKQGP